MTKSLSIPSRFALRSSFTPQKRSTFASASNLSMRSSPARFEKLKACVDEQPTESTASRMKKVFVVQPKSHESNEFYVTLEIKSQHDESDILEVICEEDEADQVNLHSRDKNLHTIDVSDGAANDTIVVVVNETGKWVMKSAVEFLQDAKEVFGEFVEDDLKKSFDALDVYNLLQLAKLFEMYPNIKRLQPVFAIAWFVLRVHMRRASKKK